MKALLALLPLALMAETITGELYHSNQDITIEMREGWNLIGTVGNLHKDSFFSDAKKIWAYGKDGWIDMTDESGLPQGGYWVKSSKEYTIELIVSVPSGSSSSTDSQSSSSSSESSSVALYEPFTSEDGWITTDQSLCELYGGEWQAGRSSSGYSSCQLNKDGAEKICSDLGGRLPDLQEFLDLATSCGAYWLDSHGYTYIPEPEYPMCLRYKGIFTMDGEHYWVKDNYNSIYSYIFYTHNALGESTSLKTKTTNYVVCREK